MGRPSARLERTGGAVAARPAPGRGRRRAWASLAAAVVLLVSLVAAQGLVVGRLTSAGAGGATLPRCPSTSTWPVRSVSAPVRTALTRYYAARHLTPITVKGNRMWVLSVKLESVGVHWCLNTGGGRSGYVGVVPKGARAAVMVEVTHRPYPVTGSATTFATLAELAAGWKVVSDDTGP